MSRKQELVVMECDNKAEALKALEAFDMDHKDKAKYPDYVRAYTDVKPLPNQKVQVTILFNYLVTDQA